MKSMIIIMCTIFAFSFCGCTKNADNANVESVNTNASEDSDSMKCNNMSYKEIAKIFKEMGIADLSDSQIKDVEAASNWPGSEEDSFKNQAANMLISIGYGNYNDESKKWIPSSDKVYCFDAEVSDCDRMYISFLEGVVSINNKEFEISDVKEDTSKVDYENGTGTQKISFFYNKKPYSYDAKVEYDWFDGGIFKFMNDVLKKEGKNKKLYYMSDGYQEIIVFYCTDKWAEEFYEKLGCKLSCE